MKLAFPTTRDLPKDVLAAIEDEEGRQIWRDAYNSAYTIFQDKKRATQGAWRSVEKRYEKGRDGKYRLREVRGCDY